MSWLHKIIGYVSGNGVEVTSNNRMKVDLETNANSNPSQVGAVRFFSENDAGTITGTPYLYSPETDDDFRLRIATEQILDTISFNHTAQQTNRYRALTTTMTVAESGGVLTTNASSITTTTTGVFCYSDAAYTVAGAQILYAEFEAAFTAAVTSNATIEFGLFNAAAASTPYASADGVCFRLNSSGMTGVRINNTAETATSVFSFTHTINQAYKFVIVLNIRELGFWINDDLYATLDLDGTSLGAASFQQTYRWYIRQAHVGAAGAVIQGKFSKITISSGGPDTNITPGEMAACRSENGNQLIVGSTVPTGGTALLYSQNYLNSANPTAAVPTNTTSALVASALGGQFWETDTLAVTTDGIIQSYQVANHTTSPTVSLKKLVIYGITIDSHVQTALTGGGYVASWSLCFGHTAVSLATAEAATTKAPRRIALGFQTVASGATALTLLNRITQRFDGCPIIVNPGEFVATVKKKIGTAPSAGTIAHVITFDCKWI